MELYNFSEYDLTPALAAQGIEHWGCPMNGAFRFEPLPLFADRLGNIRSWWNRGQRTGAAGFLVTSWEAYRLAIELTTVVDAAAACLWTNPAIDHHADMLAKGFERVFGKSGAREAARAALRCDEHAFAGYARWEINERWDGCAQPESAAPYSAEARFFTRLSQQRLPEPFAASVSFRRYLAERDVFVRSAVRGVYAIRRLLQRGAEPSAAQTAVETLQESANAFYASIASGREAAIRMWRCSRDPQQRGQNEVILDRDEQRLRDWLRWLGKARTNPTVAVGGTPLCGTWQLECHVHNENPALQKVVVEQQTADGLWRELVSRLTIEFRGPAARSRTRIRRTLSVPIEDPQAALRIAVRGLGRVAISHCKLVNGVQTRLPHQRPLQRRTSIGRPAPHHGFPEIDWTQNRGELLLRFRTK
jgi:hypothetical protein